MVLCEKLLLLTFIGAVFTLDVGQLPGATTTLLELGLYIFVFYGYFKWFSCSFRTNQFVNPNMLPVDFERRIARFPMFSRQPNSHLGMVRIRSFITIRSGLLLNFPLFKEYY